MATNLCIITYSNTANIKILENYLKEKARHVHDNLYIEQLSAEIFLIRDSKIIQPVPNYFQSLVQQYARYPKINLIPLSIEMSYDINNLESDDDAFLKAWINHIGNNCVPYRNSVPPENYTEIIRKIDMMHQSIETTDK